MWAKQGQSQQGPGRLEKKHNQRLMPTMWGVQTSMQLKQVKNRRSATIQTASRNTRSTSVCALNATTNSMWGGWKNKGQIKELKELTPEQRETDQRNFYRLAF